jgi:Flp pilus assembly protein TadG
MRARFSDPLRSQRGQALIEMAMVVTLLVTLSIGIIEVGRAFMVLNMITNIARDAARLAAGAPSSSRDSTGTINAATLTTIRTQITNQVAQVASGTTITTPVPIDQVALGGLNVVRVTLSGQVPLIFNLLGGPIDFTRYATFRDEGK